MEAISKEEKINFLKELMSSYLGIAADNDLKPDLWNSANRDYLALRSIIADYSPEEASKYSDDFLTAVNEFIEELNELVEKGNG